MASDEREEQYILRVTDKPVAERIRRLLRADSQAKEREANIQLTFDTDPWHGKLVVGPDTLPVTVLDLPAVVESYKTYDDVNLVKTNDIGQVLVVGEAGSSAAEGGEAMHGVTPPMRDARRRHFRRQPEVDPQLVQRTEQHLLTILAGGAPDGVEYEDVEEEYVVDEAGLSSWQPVQRNKPSGAGAGAAGGAGGTKKPTLKIKGLKAAAAPASQQQEEQPGQQPAAQPQQEQPVQRLAAAQPMDVDREDI